MQQKSNKRASLIRRKKVYSIMSRIFVGTIAGILLLNIILPSREFSSNENRSLASRPAISLSTLSSGKFFKDFNTYYSDQFAGRDIWMSVKALGGAIGGNRESNNVIFGKHGYLFQYPTVPSDSAIVNTANAINSFTDAHSDLRQTMILVPDAADILDEELPANAPVRNQSEDIRSFERKLNIKIGMVDAEPILESAASGHQIYYKTDHHWTSYGAYSVFLGAAEQLGIGTPVNYKGRVVSDSFKGTLASRSGRNITNDSIEIYEQDGTDVAYMVNYPDSGESSASMYVSDKLKEKDHYQIFFGGNHPLVEIKTTADNQRNLLIFKDSYANSFVQFLIPYYEKIILVDPRYYYDNINTAMTSYGITDVLYLYSADTLLTDTGLADTLNTGSAE